MGAPFALSLTTDAVFVQVHIASSPSVYLMALRTFDRSFAYAGALKGLPVNVEMRVHGSPGFRAGNHDASH